MRRLIFAGSLVALAACGTEPSSGPGDTAEIRLLQADPAVTQASELTVDGVVVAGGISYGAASALVRTAAGTHRIAIRSGGVILSERDETLAAGGRYYAVNATGQLTVTHASNVAPDTGQRLPTRANIRFVNIAGGGPAIPGDINAILRSPTTVDTAQTFGIDTRVNRYWSLMYLSAGPINIKFQPVGQSTLLAELTFDVAAGEVKAVIIERDATGALRPRVVIEP